MRRSRGAPVSYFGKTSGQGGGGGGGVDYEEVKGERGSIVSHLSEFEFPIF